MIERYTLPEMGAIWSEQAKFQSWLDVEIAATEANCELGRVPAEAVATIKDKASFSVERILEIEAEVRHDVIAFLTNVNEHVGDAGRHIHVGMTSSDVLDTGVALQMKASVKLLRQELDLLATGGEKWALFGAFMSIIVAGFSFALFVRVVFFTVTGQNAFVEGVDAIAYGTPDYISWFAALTAIPIGLIFIVFGTERAKIGWAMGKGLVAPIVVIGVVLGSIYGGISGITEAAGMGVVAVLIISFLRGEASFDLVWESLMRTLKSTGTIIWVTIGAAALAGAYTIAGGPQYVADMIVDLDVPTMGILLIMMLILLFMGAFMDWVGIVLLIIPVFLPIVQRLPIEEIGFIGELEPKHLAVWFGVLFCMNMQVSFLSPPFGPAAFYLKSVAPPHISLTDIFKGFLPFIGVQLIALSVLLIWPNIVTVLL